MPNKQIIFVVETNDKKQTDDIYIKKFINSYYDFKDNNVTIKFVHMGGKSNYKNKSITTKINNLKRLNGKGENIVIYCFDTDRIDFDNEAVLFLEEVERYCKLNKYDLIWFCYDIENVFLGRTVNDEDKVKEAIRYKQKEIKYESKFIISLSVSNDKNKSNNKSNIVLILNKYLRKLNA